MRKQRLEDANDPHKSLDFGVDMAAPSARGKRRVPEMTITEIGDHPAGRKQRGLSMDMDIASPYLLPAALQGSRGSINSMSRSMHDEHDPYRPVAMIRTSQDSRRPRNDAASLYSASTDHLHSHEKAGLMANAERMSYSEPKRTESMSPQDSAAPREVSSQQLHSNNRSAPPAPKSSTDSSADSLTNAAKNGVPPRKQSLPQSLPRPAPPSQMPLQQLPRGRASSSAVPHGLHKSSTFEAANIAPQSSVYGNDVPAAPAFPIVNEPDYFFQNGIPSSMMSARRSSNDAAIPSGQQGAGSQKRESVMGLRPLPPNMPEDDPEIRANRIRSFYKEYFDDSRPNPAYGQYEEDYDPRYMDSGNSGFATPPNKPFAAPVGRRAMTPPPRGAAVAGGPYSRRKSTTSAERGESRGRSGLAPPMPQPPKKRAPPPRPLQGLPTPHKLKDFDSVISTPIDFAPPASFRDIQNGGVPDSPTGLSRPYSPTVRAFTPLATATDDLQVIPSPHLLRQSSTFTSLDFAPPSRAWVGDTAAGSDAGSIRSARSGISAVQRDAVRAGAYRVSRIPKDVVTTQDDLANQLRPQMNLTRPA